jgi:anhydro-N-acetylmuramic acid kinase
MNTLALRCPQPVASGEDFGVDPDAREALVFATLGARCALALPVTRPSATGARAGRVLGKLSWPALD